MGHPFKGKNAEDWEKFKEYHLRTEGYVPKVIGQTLQEFYEFRKKLREEEKKNGSI